MRTLSNNITVGRGEQFSIDFEIKNLDGSPYVFAHDMLDNHSSYICISVSSTDGFPHKFVRRHWLKIDELGIPTFDSSLAVDVSNWNDEFPTSPSALPSWTEGGTTIVYTEPDEAVFYIGDDYRRAVVAPNTTPTLYNYVPYEPIHIVDTFSSEETLEFWDKMQYSISLCYGRDMTAELVSDLNSKGISFSIYSTNDEKKQLLLDSGDATLIRKWENVDVSVPLYGNFTMISMIEPSTISVYTSIMEGVL